MTKSNRRTIRAFTKAGGKLLFTAAIALGTTTLGYPAIAGADPNNGGGTSGSSEWDIGAYDFCMKNHPPLYTLEDNLDHHRWCCESTTRASRLSVATPSARCARSR